ncbi:50S ribosomal protein L34e [Candidatus Woesearchaeota archaeon]|nr:50S ribosomal protein L34e [Candidatus Woesearchaeota archaeon]
MVAPRLRSRTFRRRLTRTPGSRHVMHYARRKPSAAQCGSCGAALSGVPRMRPTQLKQLAKSSRRPERPFGGVLCSRCSRARFKTLAQSL